MRVLITASAGTQRLLAGECGDLGLRPKRVPAHGVELDLDWGQIAHALVHISIGQRVLIRLCHFPCDGADSLYEGALSVDWSKWIDADQTLAVAATGRLPKPRQPGAQRGQLTHHVFASQRVKDAICDQLRERSGRRPSVQLDYPDVRVVARFHGDACSLWLDPAGTALHRRGYRGDTGAAPLRETLAAAIIYASEWHGERPLVDPFCGSGTVLIEAAQLALGLAPGRNRGFAASGWRHEGAELGPLIEAAQERERAHAKESIAKANIDIRGYDINVDVLRAARVNIARAGLANVIRVEQGDATRMPPPAPGTAIICNPPYGERLGGDEVIGLYEAMGRHWAEFTGCEAHLLDGHEAFIDAFGLEWADSLQLTNGSLPVVLRHYRLGGRRKW
ncbi:MAG: RNA methyltransferase [Myxococcales bacterium]|nr:RNA methyltransferase [Myxococcales bacterium]